jgi:hypothetical protein
MTPTVETIMAADLALTRLIGLVIELSDRSGDEESIEQLKARADEIDARRAEVMARIRGH